MKKVLFSILFTISSLYGNSQKYVVEVSSIQNFEHPLMLTNDAIQMDSIVYSSSGNTGKSTYIFDLKNKKLHRNMNGLIGTFDILIIGKNNGIFHVQVFFPDTNIKAYYTLTEVNSKNKMLVCRWTTDNKIVGWFDNNVKIKKES
jgi:hypothetical protein